MTLVFFCYICFYQRNNYRVDEHTNKKEYREQENL